MRNAALVLGLIGGCLALVLGFFVYGYVVFIDWFGEVPDLARQVEDPQMKQSIAVIAPILGIAGGAMARARALWGGVLMLLAAAGIWHGLGLGVFTIFPVALLAVGGLLAIAAGRPDEERAHF
jgi:hypothetical protein